MDEIKAKQQIVEKIKESEKILITVSDNPSVDALSAALALTMVLDKQEKYATAIFSGETPPAIAFLEPEKTFDDTTDSLRDFIIALNKEKADHLRMSKPEPGDDMVRIYVTPYKTTITQDDLQFSQGDYNVELVIALGVDNQDHLDKALENHGKILHDAAIITMTAGEQSSDLGGIDWHDSGSSSLSEMVAGLAEALKEDRKKPLIDAPIATALLTGIVAETDRFSNEHTTSKAMTVAATLMAAGADQQLIANELQASLKIASSTTESSNDEDDHSENDKDADDTSKDDAVTIEKEHDPNSLEITHEESESLADLDRRVRGDEEAKERVIGEVEAAEEKAAEDERDTQDAGTQDAPEEAVNPAVPEQTAEPILATTYEAEDDTIEPALGGALNATTEQAADDARREAENDQNKTILTHAYIGGDDVPTASSPSLVGTTPEGFPGTPSTTPGSMGVNDLPSNEDLHSAYAFDDAPATDTQTPPNGITGERVIQPLEQSSPEPAPTSAYSYGPEPLAPVFNPTPVDLGLPLPPPIPDFSQVNGTAPAFPLPPAPQPAILGDILAPEPAAYFDNSNAVPAPDTAYAPEETAPLLPPPLPPLAQEPQSAPADPGQFQIPPAA
ncbi:MAG: DHH family phosphoesterase [Candidatus Saccharimonadaceae bacterium]